MRDDAGELHAQLPEGDFPLGEHAVQDDGRVGRLGGADRVLGQLQEVLGDLGGAAYLAVQHHQRAGPLGVERAAVQQVGQRADRREAVVQGVEYVGRSFVQRHPPDIGGWRRPWGRRRRRRHVGTARRRRAIATDQDTEGRAHQAAEGERNPEFHGS